MEFTALLRELTPRALGALVRRHRDFAACEDAVQDALIAAARSWPRAGVPDAPLAWLIQVAHRRLVDAHRADAARRAREEAMDIGGETLTPRGDDSLELLFLCCHDSLSPASAIALTLRAMGGLTTAEIARAFLVPETTMAQRLSRARESVRAAGVTGELSDAARRSRLPAVMHVLYLIFNEGYVATSGTEVQRVDLSGEAIRLTRILRRSLPADPEVMGLLALMLLTDARKPARVGPSGEIVPLDVQDRTLWSRTEIDEGAALIHQAFAQGAVGPYQVQAAIAALHDEAPSHDDTDWRQVRALYEVLLRMVSNPVVALNHAIAVAMVDGPPAGLELLDALESRLKGNHRLDAARAHLLERSGRVREAATLFSRAAERTASRPERDYLLLKAAGLIDRDR